MPSSPHDHSLNALPPGTRVGDYTIESELGSGGFSIVYLARHHLSGNEPGRIWRVALKEYLPAEIAGRDRDGLTVTPFSSDRQGAFDDGLGRFKDEALHLVRFQRLGNVVDCLNLFEANGTAYLVMEYDDGLPLSTYLRLREEQDQPFSESDLLAVVEPLLWCLSEVHRAGVYHRDIKPGNIFVRRADDLLGRPAEPMLLDFGAAKQDYLGRHSRSGAPFTPGYAAPEQTSSMGDIGPWTDIYALGATMWRMVAGGSADVRLYAPEGSVDPVSGTWDPTPIDAQKRLAAVNWQPPRADPMPSAVELGADRFSRHILETIDHCLSLYPKDRPHDCDELRERLSGAEVNAEGSNAPKSSEDQSRTSLKSGRVTQTGGGAASSWRRVSKFGFLAAATIAVIAIVTLLQGECPPWIDLAPQPFTVETTPSHARIRLLEDDVRYLPGMRLRKGEYRIAVSAPGFRRVLSVVTHGACKPTSEHVALTRVGVGDLTERLGREPSSVAVTNINGWTDLHYAAALELPDLAIDLLNEDMASDVRLKDNRCRFAEDLMDVLADLGADFSNWRSTGDSPLHVAASLDAVAVANVLIERGADVEAVDSAQSAKTTPLIAATRHDSRRVARLLLQHGADANLSPGYSSPLEAAVQSGSSAMANMLLRRGATTPDDIVAQAVRWSSINTVLALIQHGADVNGWEEGWEPARAPLHFIPEHRGDRTGVARLLIESGCGCQHRQEQGNPHALAPGCSIERRRTGPASSRPRCGCWTDGWRWKHAAVVRVCAEGGSVAARLWRGSSRLDTAAFGGRRK